MARINILDYEINSAQGDLENTLKSIKNQNICISSKNISSNGVDVEIPFFSFQKEIEQNQYAIYKALKEIVQKIVSKIDESKKSSTAIIIGTSIVDWNLVDAINSTVYEYKKTPYYSKKRSIDSYAKDLACEFGLNDFTMTINTACTSSANALLEASNLIECEVVDYAIVIGLEIFSPIMSSGFYTMDLISTTKIKPFDIDRDGLILGEAIGAILLGKDKSKWLLRGGFSNCNSQTITSVSSDGDECVEVMQKALQNCNLKLQDIKALKAHATGSTSNDVAEINAIGKLFDSSLIFSGLKPYIGHTIGASGVVEIAILIACVDDGFIPKTINHHKPIIYNYSPITKDVNCKNGIFMCNYFGFGGNNISLIIEKES